MVDVKNKKIIAVNITEQCFEPIYENIEKNNNFFKIGDYIAYIKKGKLCFGNIYTMYHPNTQQCLNSKPIFDNKERIHFMVNDKVQGGSYAVDPIREKIIKVSETFVTEFLNILTELPLKENNHVKE
jgi:hypothetical protein